MKQDAERVQLVRIEPQRLARFSFREGKAHTARQDGEHSVSLGIGQHAILGLKRRHLDGPGHQAYGVLLDVGDDFGVESVEIDVGKGALPALLPGYEAGEAELKLPERFPFAVEEVV